MHRTAASPPPFQGSRTDERPTMAPRLRSLRAATMRPQHADEDSSVESWTFILLLLNYTFYSVYYIYIIAE